MSSTFLHGRRSSLVISKFRYVVQHRKIWKAADSVENKLQYHLNHSISTRKSSTVNKMSFGQFAATSQFYLYGRSWCTRTGWEKMSKKYAQPDILESDSLNLADKVFMVTGANSGIGKEMCLFLAAKGATVYMVCRSPERGQKARDEVAAKGSDEKVAPPLIEQPLMDLLPVRAASAVNVRSPRRVGGVARFSCLTACPVNKHCLTTTVLAALIFNVLIVHTVFLFWIVCVGASVAL